MLIFAMDDESLMLEALETALKEALPDAEIRGFSHAAAALDAMRTQGLKPHAVFTDIEMPGMSGLELAQSIQALSPRSNIIFVTGFLHYAMEALQQHASGYIMKPVSREKVQREMDHLRFREERPPRSIRIQCFGNFEVFARGKPVKFRYAKSKELLAYLVDRRGASMNTSQLCAVLWENAEDTPSLHSQFRNLLADLAKTLSDNGGEQVLVKEHNSLAVDVNAFDCDLYDYLSGAASAALTGEYMSQYSWAEGTLAYIGANGQNQNAQSAMEPV